MIRDFLKACKGAVAFEYAIIAGIVSVAIIAGVTSVGSSSVAMYDKVDEQITGTAN